MIKPDPEVRCGNTVHSEYVTDHRCNLLRGHRGDCSFGTVTQEPAPSGGEAKRALYGVIGIVFVFAIIAVMLIAAMVLGKGVVEVFQWTF